MPSDGLVPEGFDLKAAKQAKSTTPRSDRNQCPECGSIKLTIRTGRDGRDRTHDTEYSCRKCGAHFDEPLGEADA